ncbi:hypothetical protein AB4874_16065 [Thioclava sp. 15-R06ZXC-3]|uniref:Uncharacterized protein n=1 Tax=Thioclava arctica TaxID=3238301 RepID=A0ABV3TNK2_9RHOB
MTTYERKTTMPANDLSPQEMTPKDEIWLNAFVETMSKPSAREVAFFAHRRALRLGVGLSKEGMLVSGQCEPKG